MSKELEFSFPSPPGISANVESAKVVARPRQKRAEGVKPKAPTKDWPAPGQEFGDVPRRTYYRRREVDAKLTAQDWKNVAVAYLTSQSQSKICKATGLTYPIVKHVLRHGVVYLTLPSLEGKPRLEIKRMLDNIGVDSLDISATVSEERDLELEVERKFIQPSTSRPGKQGPFDLSIIERRNQETAACSNMLKSVLASSVTLLDYVNQMMEKARDPNGGFAIPDHIQGSHLILMAKAAQALAGAVDKTVRLSKLVSGEPEQNIAIKVAGLVMHMTPQELIDYKSGGEIPPRILGFAEVKAMDMLPGSIENRDTGINVPGSDEVGDFDE